MKKDVMIYIKGNQDIDGEKDTVEFFTKGRYYKNNNARFLSYEEIDEETSKVTKTLLKIEDDKCVTMTRSGGQKSQLVIEKGMRHQCLYDNGFSDWVMGIQGREIKNGLEDNGGTLDFSYFMDINAMLESEHEINIVVKECENNA